MGRLFSWGSLLKTGAPGKRLVHGVWIRIEKVRLRSWGGEEAAPGTGGRKAGMRAPRRVRLTFYIHQKYQVGVRKRKLAEIFFCLWVYSFIISGQEAGTVKAKGIFQTSFLSSFGLFLPCILIMRNGTPGNVTSRLACFLLLCFQEILSSQFYIVSKLFPCGEAVRLWKVRCHWRDE